MSKDLAVIGLIAGILVLAAGSSRKAKGNGGQPSFKVINQTMTVASG